MAGSTKISDYRFSIFINNDQAKRSLIEMEKVMQGYEAELSKLIRDKKQDTQEYRDAKKVYDDHLEKMKKLRQEAGLQALSIKELTALRGQLRNEMARAIPGSAHAATLQKEIDAVHSRLTQLNGTAKNTTLSFGQIADSFNRFQAFAVAGIAVITGFALSIKSMIAAQGELDDSLADIRKTTQMSAAEVQNLNKQLGKIDTRTSRQDLREMAVVAGQLGFAKDSVYEFVESVDKLNVALSDEIKGGAEEVSRTMGTLRNILTDMKSANIADDMLRIGNAVNELGAAGFATAPVIADFSNRIGGIGIPLGLTSNEVLGLSATLQELNVSTERGGTAVTKILQKMTTNVGDFAKIAGMPIKEFTDLVNRDLFGAFTKVLEGSKRGGQSATLLAGIIKELEVSGAGASEVFAKVSGNIEMLNEKVALAGKSLQNTDSIMNEFNIKNATLGAVLDKLQKSFYSLITMPGVTEFFKSQVYHVVELVDWFKNLPQFIEKYRVSLILIAGATGVWIAAKTRSLQVGILNNIMLKEGILLKIKDAIALEYLIIKEQLLTVWKGNGTTATKLATIAQLLWNAALKANPIGLVITAITALVGAIAAYEKYNSKALELDRLKVGTTVLLANSNKKLSESYSDIADQMRKLSLLSVNEKKDLQDKIDLKIKEAEAELLLMEAKQKAIGKAAAKPTGWQNLKAATEVGPKQQQALEVYAWQNQKEATEPFDDGINKLKDGINKLKGERQTIVQILNAESAGDQILGKLAPQLEEKLNQYRIALNNTIAGSEDYLRIQEKIKATNKELAKYNDTDNTTVTSYKANQKAAKENADYLISIQKKIEDATIQLIKDQKEKELKLNELDHKRKIELIQGMSADELKLRELYWQQAQDKEAEINKKYSDKAIAEAIKIEEEKWKAIIDADIKGSESWYANSITLLEKQQQLELSNLELTEQEKTDIVAKYEAKRAALRGELGLIGPVQQSDEPQSSGGNMLHRSGADQLGEFQLGEKRRLLQLTRDLELENAQGSADAQKQIWAEFYASQTAATIEFINAAAQVASQVVSALSGVNQAMSDYENAQLKKDEDSNNKKKANLKARFDSGKITQKQYNDQVAKLDADLDAKKKELSIKQAKRQKALSLAQAIISTAQAITSSLAQGGIIGIIMAALVGILGAVQIAYIASTPIPEAAKGRYRSFMKARQAAKGRYQPVKQSETGRYDISEDNNYSETPGRGLFSIFRSRQAAKGRYNPARQSGSPGGFIKAESSDQIPQAATGRYELIEKQDSTQTVIHANEPARPGQIQQPATSPIVTTDKDGKIIVEVPAGNQGASDQIPQAATGRYELIEKQDSTQTVIHANEPTRPDHIQQPVPQPIIIDNSIAKTGRLHQPGPVPSPGPDVEKQPLRYNQDKIILDLNTGDWISLPAGNPQAAAGRYNVVGEDDRKQYRDVPYLPEPKSGIYTTPTLFAETGREIILNPKHTENLIRFHPDLVEQIMRVPQRAEGTYPTVQYSKSPEQKPALVSFDVETLQAIKDFKEIMSRPVRADISYDTMIDSISKVESIESDASR